MNPAGGEGNTTHLGKAWTGWTEGLENCLSRATPSFASPALQHSGLGESLVRTMTSVPRATFQDESKDSGCAELCLLSRSCRCGTQYFLIHPQGRFLNMSVGCRPVVSQS